MLPAYARCQPLFRQAWMTKVFLVLVLVPVLVLILVLVLVLVLVLQL